MQDPNRLKRTEGCDPPEVTPMIFGACVFRAGHPQHGQVLKAAPRSRLQRSGGVLCKVTQPVMAEPAGLTHSLSAQQGRLEAD